MKYLALFAQIKVDANSIGLPKVSADNATLAAFLSAAFTVIGGIAVLFLLIGAIRYVTSGGDSGQVASAKNTIIYALVGIVVSVSAFAIVQFVLGSIF